MTERKIVQNHPMKVNVDSFEADTSLRAEDGWVDMDVKWLITSDSVGAKETVFGITIFPPGAKHDIHHHPNAEETEYVIEGEGVARVGDEDVAMKAGDIVFVPAGDNHGFVNTSSSKRAVMIWCYGGAASLEAAGYARAEEQHPKGQLDQR